MKRHSNRRRLPGLVLMLLGLGLVCLTLVRNMDPLVRDMAVAGAKNAAAAAMQKAVAARMTGGQWSDLVQLVKDGEGQITAAVTDVGRVNELQAALAGDVIAALTAPNTADLGVPLGNLLPSPFFSGLGPKVPIRILSVSEVEVKLMSRFGWPPTRAETTYSPAVEQLLRLPVYSLPLQYTTTDASAEART